MPPVSVLIACPKGCTSLSPPATRTYAYPSVYHVTRLYLYIRLAEFSEQSPRLFSCLTSLVIPSLVTLSTSYLIYGVSLLGGLLHNHLSPKQRFPRISSLLIPALVGPQGFTQLSSTDTRRAR